MLQRTKKLVWDASLQNYCSYGGGGKECD